MVENLSVQVFCLGTLRPQGKALVSLCLHVTRWSACLYDLVLEWEKPGNWNHAFTSAIKAAVTIALWCVYVQKRGDRRSQVVKRMKEGVFNSNMLRPTKYQPRETSAAHINERET